jgi:hypothetical protein
MTREPPSFNSDQLAFAARMGEEMAPLIGHGMDLPQVERVAAHSVADAMFGEGADRELVDWLLADALRRSDVGQRIKHSDIPASPALQEQLIVAFKAAGGRRLSPIGLLVEKRVTTNTGYPLILYSNESQHPGLPHVTIVLGDERVNVTIAENPVILAGNKRARGLRAAIRAIGIHHRALRQEWDDSRPDDQKLENSKRRKVAVAKASK